MRWVIILLMVTGGLLTWSYWGSWAEPNTIQPIEFPHKTHIKLKLKCTTCHQQAEKGPVAGRPPTTLCLACHLGRDTKSQEVKKLQAFGKKGRQIPWRRVWRLPSHVFFSHRTHVSVAKEKCQTCHGPMETLTKPPGRPLKKLSMNDCIGCHEKKWGKSPKQTMLKEKTTIRTTRARRVTTDCITCHR